MVNMKTINDIFSKREDENTILVAFGIDGEIIDIMPTYVWFFELIKNNIIEENLSAAENEFLINIKNENGILETISCTEKLSAILRSNPDIIELARKPLPKESVVGIKRFVDIGWKYDNNHNFIPPKNWVDPKEKTIEFNENQFNKLTDEQKAEVIKRGWKKN